MKIKFDNVYSYIETENKNDEKSLDNLRDTLQTTAPGAIYTWKYKQFIKTKGRQGWDGKVTMLDKYTFLTGLLPKVISLLKTNYELIDIRSNKFSQAEIRCELWEELKHGLQLREYQEDALEEMLHNSEFNLWWPRGVLEAATGAGKTEVAAAIIKSVAIPTIFLVHRTDLLNQTIKRFTKYGIEVGKVGNKEKDFKDITVATVQTLNSLIKAGNIQKTLDKYQQLFIDEAHLAASSLEKGNIFVKVASHLPNAFMRWGLTATPFSKDNYSNWLLEGVTGKSIYKITTKELIDEGYLTRPKVMVLKSPKVQILGLQRKWPDCYDRGIVLNEERNKLIITKLLQLPTPSMIMVNQITHGNIIKRLAKESGVEIPFINGETPTEYRKEIISSIINQKINRVIVSTIFDEGIDLPPLRSLILAGGGKSKIKALQRIGRGLRKAEGKQEFIAVDFIDESSGVLKRHSEERLKIWKEQGFEIVQ